MLCLLTELLKEYICKPMKLEFSRNGNQYSINSNEAIDISIPMVGGEENVNAYYIDQPKYEVFRAGGFVGSVAEGGACNCENIYFNPHGNGTHTECVGHVSKKRITINSCLNEFIFGTQLVTVQPKELENGDLIIDLDNFPKHALNQDVESIIIRTWPNPKEKLSKNYSGSNPPYLSPELCLQFKNSGIKHLLVDFPSVDREDDGGLLLAHKNFWNYPEAPRMDATITEMVYVKDSIPDGFYVMNLQIASFESDASPSKPILYTPIPQ